MGRVVTPTYRLEFGRVYSAKHGEVFHSASCWRGRATQARLVEYVQTFEDSTLPGGINEHLGVTRVGTAKLVRQSTGDVVAIYLAPLFEAIA